MKKLIIIPCLLLLTVFNTFSYGQTQNKGRQGTNLTSNSKEYNTNVQEKYFTTSDGVKLHYHVEGTGKPLVIFPGYGQDATKLENVFKGIKDHYTVYCIDNRWLGKSDSPQYGYHIERLAQDAHEMIQHAGLKRFYLFGHSMGNAVAWSYFSLFGQNQVIKYILGDEAPCIISDPFWSNEEVETYTGSKERRELFKAFRSPVKPASLTLQQDMMDRLLSDHLSRDWRDIVATIKIPTMIVMGGKSHYASPLLWNWLHTTIKGSRLEVMHEAGHAFYESHPAIFNGLVIDFFKE